MLTGNFFALGGIVMVPLLGLSILAVALIFERTLFWWRMSRQQDKVIRETLGLYRRSTKAAMQKLEQHTNLPIARIFLAAMEIDQATADDFRLALESAAQAEIPLLKRFNTVFDTIISVSPLLGLLGTILGLINSFAALKIGDVAASNTTGVTGGISEALIATASGLVVAIFTLLFANTFRGLYQRQIALIQEYGGQLELIHRRRFDREGVPHAST